MRRKLITKEEKIAIQLSNVLADLRLDLDLVGHHLAQSSPNVIYNRLITIADSAEATKQEQYNHYNNYKLFQKGCSGGLDKSLPLCPRWSNHFFKPYYDQTIFFPFSDITTAQKNSPNFRHYERSKNFPDCSISNLSLSNHVIMVLCQEIIFLK